MEEFEGWTKQIIDLTNNFSQLTGSVECHGFLCNDIVHVLYSLFVKERSEVK